MTECIGHVHACRYAHMCAQYSRHTPQPRQLLLPATTLPYISRPAMANAPTVKPWGKEDKDHLQKLIDQGKVDITKTANIDYIDIVWHKYFWVRDNHNFCRNFRSYAQMRELEDHQSG
jgi:hypothetical protein